jgi:hypothetical protein
MANFILFYILLGLLLCKIVWNLLLPYQIRRSIETESSTRTGVSIGLPLDLLLIATSVHMVFQVERDKLFLNQWLMFAFCIFGPIASYLNLYFAVAPQRRSSAKKSVD